MNIKLTKENIMKEGNRHKMVVVASATYNNNTDEGSCEILNYDCQLLFRL